MSAPRLLPSLLLAAAAGCASGGGSGRPASPAAARAEAPPRAAAPAPGAAAALSPRAQRLFEEAVAAAEEQRKLKVPTDWEVLERRWRAVVETQDVPEAWFNLGVTLERQGRRAEARSAYERALALRPSFREAAVNLAVLDEPPDPRAAAAAYVRLIQRFPEDAVARVRLAEIYRAAGQGDEAWRLAREALVRDPEIPGAQKVMMWVALERGNLDLGELLAVRAEKLAPGDPEVSWFLGEVALRRGDEPGAASRWRRALAQRDDYLPARAALLSLALRNRAWESVLEHGKALLARDPQNARAQLAVGVAYRYLGKPDEAAASYARAEALSGGRLPEVLLARGLLEMKVRGRCEPAIADFRRYAAEAGPALTSDSPVFALTRECEQILVANRQAEEAARQMQREAAKPPQPPPPPGGARGQR